MYLMTSPTVCNFSASFVGHFHRKLLLERHHQLHDVERVRPQILDERSLWRYLFRINAQLFDDDVLNLLFD